MKKALFISLGIFLGIISVIIILNILYDAPTIEIDEDIRTAKQLVAFTDNYVKRYTHKNNFYISGITMILDI